MVVVVPCMFALKLACYTKHRLFHRAFLAAVQQQRPLTLAHLAACNANPTLTAIAVTIAACARTAWTVLRLVVVQRGHRWTQLIMERCWPMGYTDFQTRNLPAL